MYNSSFQSWTTQATVLAAAENDTSINVVWDCVWAKDNDGIRCTATVHVSRDRVQCIRLDGEVVAAGATSRYGGQRELLGGKIENLTYLTIRCRST